MARASHLLEISIGFRVHSARGLCHASTLRISSDGGTGAGASLAATDGSACTSTRSLLPFKVDVIRVRLVAIIRSAILSVNFDELLNALLRVLQLLDQERDAASRVFLAGGVVVWFTSPNRLHGTRVSNIIDTVNDLTNFLAVLILVVDFFLEVLLEARVLGGDLLERLLDGLHLTLTIVQRLLELVQLGLLARARLLHLLIDKLFL